MRPYNKLIQQRVILFICNLILNGNQHIFKIHDRINHLHGILWQISNIPRLQCNLLRFLQLSLADVVWNLLVARFV